jgi:FtsZ-interacting cell division protein ZipA
MPELRWTLLIIGVVFIAVLAWWERRKPHQAARDSGELRPSVGGDSGWGPEDLPSGRAMREPTLTLPEIRAREPAAAHELPVVEIADDSFIGLRVDGDPVERQVAAQEAASAAAATVSDAIVPLPPVPVSPAAAPLSSRPELPATPMPDMLQAPARSEPSVLLQPPLRPPPATLRPPPRVETVQEDEPEEEMEEPMPVAAMADDDEAPEESAGESSGADEPIVDWPPEEIRKLVGLRLVAPQAERLAGRALRQALAAEGFVLGKYDIFHKPDAANRAVLSAASLTKPGTFDLETMDTQRYTGLNLFAVLPGPKPPLKAFDELLVTARALNERLEGALQDDRGGPLTPTRAAAMRSALEAEARP